MTKLKLKFVAFDMDQVLCDWNLGASRILAKHHGVSVEEISKRLDEDRVSKTEYDINELKKQIDAFGPEWWATLPPMTERFPKFPTFEVMYEHAKRYTDRVIIISAGKSGAAVAGKVDWLQRRIPGFRDFVLVGEGYLKQFLASPRSPDELAVLFDDWHPNCAQFAEAGGLAVQVKTTFDYEQFKGTLAGFSLAAPAA